MNKSYDSVCLNSRQFYLVSRYNAPWTLTRRGILNASDFLVGFLLVKRMGGRLSSIPSSNSWSDILRMKSISCLTPNSFWRSWVIGLRDMTQGLLSLCLTYWRTEIVSEGLRLDNRIFPRPRHGRPGPPNSRGISGVIPNFLKNEYANPKNSFISDL